MSERRQGYKRHGSRYKARRRAVDILFEAEARDADPVAVVEDRKVLATDVEPIVAPVAEYTDRIVNGVAVELDIIDELLAEHIADTWKLERLPSVDRAILRVAAWELLFNDDVPFKTAVVEAVEIAAEYSTDDAGPYINATLDAMASHIDELRQRATATPAVEDGVDIIDDDSLGLDLDFAEGDDEVDSEGDLTRSAPWDDSARESASD